MKWHILEPEQYNRELNLGCAQAIVSSEIEKEKFRNSIFTTQKLIEDALLAKWKREDDFEIGWDFDYCYFVCGGVYSREMIGPDYVATVLKALKSAPEPHKWTFHSTCELNEFDSEFFVRNGEGFVENSAPPEFLNRLTCRSVE
jgi:hypothetical protein